MKTLILDLETSPNVAHVWGLFNQTVSLSQLRESTRVICFAAKWHGSKKVEFHSDFHNGHEDMVAAAYDLIGSADVVVHFNGKRFDMRHLRKEFLLAGMPPYRPVQEIDLYQEAKQFAFSSHKLEHLLNELSLGGKVKHAGHGLWVGCMAGDPKSWADMRRYNIGDIRKTEELYDRLRPWLRKHPHMGLYTGDPNCCPNCGSINRQKRGPVAVGISLYQQFCCNDCGRWYRGSKTLFRVDERGAA